MSESYNELMKKFDEIKNRLPFVPKIALILGSGLGGYADGLEIKGEIPYSEIPGFPVSTVEGHRGRFVFAYVEGVPVVMMQGRVHLYEGYAAENVVLPVRLMKLMGAETLILTNGLRAV